MDVLDASIITSLHFHIGLLTNSKGTSSNFTTACFKWQSFVCSMYVRKVLYAHVCVCVSVCARVCLCACVCVCVYISSMCVLKAMIDFYFIWGSVCVAIAYHTYESGGNRVPPGSQSVWTS